MTTKALLTPGNNPRVLIIIDLSEGVLTVTRENGPYLKLITAKTETRIYIQTWALMRNCPKWYGNIK